MSELHKALDNLKITAVVKDMPSVPARESPIRPWRITLVRTVGRGKDAQEIRLSAVMLSETRPILHDMVTSLIHDAAAGEQKLWDFAQTFAEGKIDEQTEVRHKACKRIGNRIRRFFGDDWTMVTQAEQGIPIPTPVAKAGKQPRKLKKSA